MVATKLPPGVNPINTLPTWPITYWVLGRSGNWAKITGFGKDDQHIELLINNKYIQISLAKVLGWAELPPGGIPQEKPKAKQVKPQARIHPLAAKFKPRLEGEVWVCNLEELNAWLTGDNPRSTRRFHRGDRVRYTGANPHLQRQLSGKVLTVHEILANDPRWINCTYQYEHCPWGGEVETRTAITTWIKGEELSILQN